MVPGEIVVTPDGFHVEATMPGTDARELNRTLLSALRSPQGCATDPAAFGVDIRRSHAPLLRLRIKGQQTMVTTAKPAWLRPGLEEAAWNVRIGEVVVGPH